MAINQEHSCLKDSYFCLHHPFDVVLHLCGRRHKGVSKLQYSGFETNFRLRFFFKFKLGMQYFSIQKQWQTIRLKKKKIANLGKPIFGLNYLLIECFGQHNSIE